MYILAMEAVELVGIACAAVEECCSEHKGRHSRKMRAVRIRGGMDRVRYALLFEAILIVLMAGALWLLSYRPVIETGALAIILSVIAVFVALIYNYVLDRVDAYFGRVPTERSILGRIGHALGLEIVLVGTSLPAIMWWMNWGFWKALTFDLAAIAFVLIYTYLFTYAYDKAFPVPQDRS